MLSKINSKVFEGDVKLLVKRRVVITGMGVVTGNANNASEFSESLKLGKTGLKKSTHVDLSKLRTEIVGQVDQYNEFNKPDDIERTTYLADKAINEAINDSGLTLEYIRDLDDRIGFSFSTSLASNVRMMKYVDEIQEHPNEFDPGWLVKFPVYLYQLINKYNIAGPTYTTMSACAAGTAGAGIGFDKIQENLADVMIVGGADPMTKFSCTGFHSLKSLSQTVCKPFDKEHDGINIGEGSGFVVLESLEHALNRGATIYAEVLGYSINNEAYHITSPNPTGEGAAKAMAEALNNAGISPDKIDYINTHGTGTKANDEMELKAIATVFGEKDKEISISSTKAMTGHCLGAAGSIELVATAISINEDFVPPTINLKSIQDGFDEYNLSNEIVYRNINYALSNSFAFAGNTASIVLKKYNEKDEL